MSSFLYLTSLYYLILFSSCNGLILKNSKQFDYDMIAMNEKSEEENLFYGSDQESTETSPHQNTLKELMMNILKNNISTDEQCVQYKSKINELCLAKYSERTRFRGNLINSEDDTLDLDSIPNAHHICCEFRLTYLQCMLSSINMVCSPTEFSPLYDQIRGLSEICSNFFKTSSRRCRRRYTILISNQNVNLPNFNITSF